MIQDNWSKDGIARVFRIDRRTVDRYLRLGDVKPADEKGPKGHALYRLREAVAVLVDAGYLGGDPDRSHQWGHDSGRESGARELAEVLLDALTKRLDPGPMRVVCEEIAAALHHHIGVVYGREDDAEHFHGRALDWRTLTDAELTAALRSLVVDGFLPGDGEDD